MQHQSQLARQFASLHVKGAPLILFNAWDAGSARQIAAAGARAIATSSMAVAVAQGYDDGEQAPFALIEETAGRMARCVALPVSVDIEGGYSLEPQACAKKVERLLDLGVVGINFEDRIVGGAGLHPIEAHCTRIAAIRAMADQRGIDLFINARTDVFFGAGIEDGRQLEEALARAAAYARAGASGLFTPGLVALPVIEQLAQRIELPLNVMMMPGAPDARELAAAGVARISHGPFPYLKAMEMTRDAAAAAFS